MCSRVFQSQLRVALLAAVVVGSVGGSHSLADEPAAPGGKVPVLNSTSLWRMHHMLREPWVEKAEAHVEPVMLDQAWLNLETPGAPKDWTDTEFDDGSWVRGPLAMACRTPYLARLSLRGSFTVTDPVAVGDLTLSVEYQGGVVVYLNGKEVARRDVVANDNDDRPLLARSYPHEAFADEQEELLARQGTLIEKGHLAPKPTAEAARRLELCRRAMENVTVPKAALRKGKNVLAVEFVRAPYDRIVLDKVKDNLARNIGAYQLRWNTCQVRDITLAAFSPAGLAPNVARPAGLQVWNRDPLDADFSTDYGAPTDTLHPVRLVGVRNGLFTGKVAVGSSKDLVALRVTAGNLVGPGGTIPASAVTFRYGTAWGSQSGRGGRSAGDLLAALSDVPLPEFKADPAVRGVTVPVWITVAVPKTAAAGIYAGRVTIGATGEKSVDLPVEVKVVDWTLPDTQDYRTWVDLIQCPDTLALEYNLPLWSEKHWQMIARSLELMGSVGCRILYVPLIGHTNVGNEQSMVRWVDQGNGKYTHDFSILDRYLDTAEKHMGKPKLICFVVWDVYLIPKEDEVTDAEAKKQGKNIGHTRMAINLAEKGATFGTGPLVTVVDPKSGETKNVYLPGYTDPVSKALWEPLFAQLIERLKNRGLRETMMLGMNTDAWASKEEFQFFKEIADNPPWVFQGHYGGPGYGKLAKDVAPQGYETQVWNVDFADNCSHHTTPHAKPMYGWKRPDLFATYERQTGLDVHPPTRWLQFGETNITGGQRGVGRMGADMWPVVKDRRDRRTGRAHERYAESNWRNLNITTSAFAPGPFGPAATNRFEALRLGIQTSEARIAIERALTDETLKAKLGDELATRCRETLEQRMLLMFKGLSNLQFQNGFACTAWRWTPGVDGHTWFLGSLWQDRDEQLFALAGEVTRKLGN